MGSLATLMATAAISIGAVAAARAIRNRAEAAARRMKRAQQQAADKRSGPVIDLEQGEHPDEWRMPAGATHE
ncbi:MAG: hypothetical protein AAF986_01015 [Pseudomonadota bacterium]